MRVTFVAFFIVEDHIIMNSSNPNYNHNHWDAFY